VGAGNTVEENSSVVYLIQMQQGHVGSKTAPIKSSNSSLGGYWLMQIVLGGGSGNSSSSSSYGQNKVRKLDNTKLVYCYIQAYKPPFLWSPYVIRQTIYIFILSCTNLGCRSEKCCMRLAGNAGCKKSTKSRHLRTIVQL